MASGPVTLKLLKNNGNFGFSRLQLHKYLITFQLQMLTNYKRNN